MAKEIIPPNPIPVGHDPITTNDEFQCATMIDSGDQYHENRGARSELVANILAYLEEVGTPWGLPDEFWKGYALTEKSVKSVKNAICKHVEGLSKKNMDNYLQVIEKNGKIIVAVFLL